MFERRRVHSTILVVLALLIWTSVAVPFVSRAHAATANITLVGALGGWNATTLNPNPTISAAEGDTLSIRLSSGDVQHQFYVDVDRDNQSEGPSCLGGPTGLDKCSYYFPPSTIYNFTVDFAPGRYTYFCSFHPDTMVGRFVVAAPSAKNFAISASPHTLSIPSGSSSTSTITLQSLNGFAGDVSLSMSSSPVGLGLASSLSTVTLVSGGSGSATVTVSTSGGAYNNAASLGNYNVTVRASSGPTIHFLIVRVIVSAPSQVSEGGSSLPLLAGGVLAAGAVVAAVFTVLAWRRRAK